MLLYLLTVINITIYIFNINIIKIMQYLLNYVYMDYF